MAGAGDLREIGALAERAIIDPSTLSDDEIRALGIYAFERYRSAITGKRRRQAIAEAETFRRKTETIQIIRGLPARLREHPTGEAAINAVLQKLKRIGIPCSERTLLRDYSALGGADWLRTIKPFLPDEDRSPIISAAAVAAAK